MPIATLLASLLGACEPADLPLETARDADKLHAFTARDEAFFDRYARNGCMTRSCLTYGPLRRFTGIWIDQFEGSRFVRGAHSIRDVVNDETSVTINPYGVDGAPTPTDDGSSRAYRIDFSGRVARHPYGAPSWFGFGHMGAFDGEVSVEHIHAIERIPMSAADWNTYSRSFWEI